MTATIPIRFVRELVFQLDHAREYRRLSAAISSVPTLLALCRAETPFEVLALWSRLRGVGLDPASTLFENIEQSRYDVYPYQIWSEVLDFAGQLFDAVADWERSSAIYQELTRAADAAGDRERASTARSWLGWLVRCQGRYDEALGILAEALRIAEDVGSRRAQWVALGTIGIVQADRREFEKALEFYRRQFEICDEIGEISGASYALGNMGLAYQALDDHVQALACHDVQLKMCREIGDRIGASYALGNIGHGYLGLHDYDSAFEHFARAIDDQRSFGSRLWLQGSLWGMAAVLLNLSTSRSEMPRYVSRYAADAGHDAWQAAIRQHARWMVEESIAITRELSMPQRLVTCQILLARIDAADGDFDAALSSLENLLPKAADDEQLADVHYWLWTITSPDDTGSVARQADGAAAGVDHRLEALRRYRVLLERRPKPELRRRIELLAAGGDDR